MPSRRGKNCFIFQNSECTKPLLIVVTYLSNICTKRMKVSKIDSVLPLLSFLEHWSKKKEQHHFCTDCH